MAVIHSFDWKSAVQHDGGHWCLKCVILYLAQDIPAFVMYCIYGESGSSQLIESTDSMMLKADSPNRSNVTHSTICATDHILCMHYANIMLIKY